MSRHNMTNPDKLKLVNYSCKTCNTENFKVQNFGWKNFDDSTSIGQIHQTFPPSKFCTIAMVYRQILKILTASWGEPIT